MHGESNQIISQIVLPRNDPWEVTVQGIAPIGDIVSPQGKLTDLEDSQLKRFSLAAVLSNDGFLGHRERE